MRAFICGLALTLLVSGCAKPPGDSQNQEAANLRVLPVITDANYFNGGATDTVSICGHVVNFTSDNITVDGLAVTSGSLVTDGSGCRVNIYN